MVRREQEDSRSELPDIEVEMDRCCSLMEGIKLIEDRAQADEDKEIKNFEMLERGNAEEENNAGHIEDTLRELRLSLACRDGDFQQEQTGWHRETLNEQAKQEELQNSLEEFRNVERGLLDETEHLKKEREQTEVGLRSISGEKTALKSRNHQMEEIESKMRLQKEKELEEFEVQMGALQDQLNDVEKAKQNLNQELQKTLEEHKDNEISVRKACEDKESVSFRADKEMKRVLEEEKEASKKLISARDLQSVVFEETISVEGEKQKKLDKIRETNKRVAIKVEEMKRMKEQVEDQKTQEIDLVKELEQERTKVADLKMERVKVQEGCNVLMTAVQEIRDSMTEVDSLVKNSEETLRNVLTGVETWKEPANELEDEELELAMSVMRLLEQECESMGFPAQLGDKDELNALVVSVLKRLVDDVLDADLETQKIRLKQKQYKRDLQSIIKNRIVAISRIFRDNFDKINGRKEKSHFDPRKFAKVISYLLSKNQIAQEDESSVLDELVDDIKEVRSEIVHSLSAPCPSLVVWGITVDAVDGTAGSLDNTQSDDERVFEASEVGTSEEEGSVPKDGFGTPVSEQSFGESTLESSDTERPKSILKPSDHPILVRNPEEPVPETFGKSKYKRRDRP
ncbi:unnamed protein product [Cyprideis torosa]|uniref:Uncharacterized protein n=1 Tax=Cyprideis torosa TaxID=163714 RepID=A0A7R8WJV2_9CRUS|nr:unnamed protein product [Cyprideis torosa]CAG0902439.1 unnamed protein product [Cyprideis torosa]